MGCDAGVHVEQMGCDAGVHAGQMGCGASFASSDVQNESRSFCATQKLFLCGS